VGFIHQQIYRLTELKKKMLNPPESDDDGSIFMVQKDSADEYSSHEEKRKHVRFPVELAVRYGEDAPVAYDSFVLNISQHGVFILTDKPFPEGTILVMHFFIPPESKLLAELRGEVRKINTSDAYPQGMHIEFFQYSETEIQTLNNFLEEKKHLLDKQV